MLNINNLTVNFYTKSGTVEAVKGINIEIKKDEVVGLVGESGSGKSVTAFSVLNLLDSPGKIETGKILWQDTDLLELEGEDIRNIRGKEIAMIFQDPYGSLNPVYSVGSQIAEVIQLHQGLDKDSARQKAIEMLKTVHIPNAEKRADDYPHQFSGGMCQRVMIAMALSCQPQLIIADEPTTALDVTIQAEILELLNEVKKKFKTSILLITHDLGIVSENCDRVYVMKEGKIVEEGKTATIFKKPKEEYTKRLLKAVPRL